MGLEELRGTSIAGRFRLGKMVGKGGYGAVFEATQLSMGRRCAVKIMLPSRTSDEDDVEQRFRTEAKNTSRLSHPHTLVVYDFGVDDDTGYLFLATEFLEGCTLHEVLDQREVLPVDRTLELVEQVAGSLGDAHSRGLVHRDVKPKNIMLCERAGRTDFVKVIDFGIAKALGGDLGEGQNLTKTGLLLGTPAYMAPEQIMGGDMEGAVDQYALALVCYRALTGRNPFAASAPMETAMRHLNDRPLPLRTYRPKLEVCAEFEDVLLKALEKPPEHRFDDIETFVEHLRDARSEKILEVSVPDRVEKVKCDEESESDETDREELPVTDDGTSEEPTRKYATTMDDAGSAEASSDPAWWRWAPKFAAISVAILAVTAGAVLLAGGSQDSKAEAEAGIETDDGSQEDGETPSERKPTKQEAAAAAIMAHADIGAAVDESREVVAEAREEALRTAEQRWQQLQEESRDAEEESQRPARVTVTLIPWGTLYVNGREYSDRVRQQVRLRPGTHRLTLRQRGEVRATEVIEVDSGERRTVALEAQFDAE